MFFTVVIAYAAIAFWHHFHPGSQKNMDLETISHFATPNPQKLTKLCQRVVRSAPTKPKAIWPRGGGGKSQCVTQNLWDLPGHVDLFAT